MPELLGYILSYLCGVVSLAIVWLVVNWRREAAEYRAEEERERAFDAKVNLGPKRRLIPVAENGCDDCSMEPGERHRYHGCPGVGREASRGR